VPQAPVLDADFLDRAGLRYLTLWIEDLDRVVERWRAGGGTVKMAATEIRPGVRTALLIDLDGNTVEAMEEAGT
jgi:predicted enzyme related to lactoylglutathione lyase